MLLSHLEEGSGQAENASQMNLKKKHRTRIRLPLRNGGGDLRSLLGGRGIDPIVLMEEKDSSPWLAKA